MQEIFIGDAIKRRRLELGLTQGQLCQGICEPITISRLENGKQMPSYNRIHALLERLDMPADRYYALLSKHELDVDALVRDIVAYDIRFENASAEERPSIRAQTMQLHQKLEEIMDKDDPLSRQALLRSRCILGREDGAYSAEEKYQLLLEALHLTAPNFDLDNIEAGLYTTDEIKIISQLASCYSRMGRSLEALHIFSRLYRYIKQHFHNIPLTRAHLTMVTYNYARELEILWKFREAIEIAEEGKTVCLDYGQHLYLAGLLGIQANCYHFLGEDDMSRDLYYQAYHLMKLTGDECNLKILKECARTHLNLELDANEVPSPTFPSEL